MQISFAHLLPSESVFYMRMLQRKKCHKLHFLEMNDDLWDRFRAVGVKLGKGINELSFSSELCTKYSMIVFASCPVPWQKTVNLNRCSLK